MRGTAGDDRQEEAGKNGKDDPDHRMLLGHRL